MYKVLLRYQLLPRLVILTRTRLIVPVTRPSLVASTTTVPVPVPTAPVLVELRHLIVLIHVTHIEPKRRSKTGIDVWLDKLLSITSRVNISLISIIRWPSITTNGA